MLYSPEVISSDRSSFSKLSKFRIEVRFSLFNSRTVFLSLAIFINATSQAPVRETEKSCRAHPQIVGKCFNIYGRLSVYNGAPSLRLWPVGSHRLLGVSEQRFAVEGFRNVPQYILKYVDGQTELFGDFVVCPFTKPRSGEMRLVCIESGKNLTVRKRR
jgi:hypothetical protein